MILKINKDSIENLSSFFKDNNIPIVNRQELENNPFLHISIYMENNQIIGYVNYSIMYNKAELNYVFVDEKYRNQKIGSKLIEYVLAECKMCENITLEVRKDNIVAISLYQKFGFRKCAIRKNYYQGMDGILMIYERGE